MIESEKFANKKILLIDKQTKTRNDRTWCFWEKEKGYFENLVYKTWHDLEFKTGDESIDLDVKPYTYKMIRGIDFYNYCFGKISTQKNITISYGEIEFKADANKVLLDGKALQILNAIVFNSVLTANVNPVYHHLLQHFKGWFVEANNAFNPNRATLMDFSVSQHNGSTFIYVLPLSSSMALVEYTLFSPALLNEKEYDDELKKYVEQNLKIKDYTIAETEFGIIPMTNQPFPFYSKGMYNIGTAGGNTKPSTGYTFRFIQKQSDHIITDIINERNPTPVPSSKKYSFYDNTFLNVLATKKLSGKDVFTLLFKKNKASAIFKFLDNESTLATDISIITSLPTLKFLKAATQEIFKG